MKGEKTVGNFIKLPARASLWYTASAAVTKGIGMLATPIFTRILSPEEYAQFPLFISWLGIIGAMCSKDPSAVAIIGGIEKFKDKKGEFIKASLGFNLTLVAVFCILFFALSSVFGNFTGLPRAVEYMLFIQLFFDTVTHHKVALWRFSYRGAPILLVNITSAVSAFLLGVFLSDLGGESRVIALLLATGVFALFFFGKTVSERGSFFDGRAWRYLFVSSVPLIPQLLASAIATVTDKLMIRAYFGKGAVGKYSVAHSLGVCTSFISAALGYALRPWILRKLGKGECSEIVRICDVSISLLSLISLLLIAISPELMLLLAPRSYSDALFAVFPIALSVLPAFANGLLTIGFIHEGKSRLCIFPAITALGINLLTNTLFFRYFPYTSAAISSLVSSVTGFLLSYLFYTRTGARLFSFRRAASYFTVSLFAGAALFIMRKLLVLRLILFLLICTLSLPYIKSIIRLIREPKRIKNENEG